MASLLNREILGPPQKKINKQQLFNQFQSMNKNLSDLQEELNEDSDNEADANLSSDGSCVFNPNINQQIGIREESEQQLET